VRRERVLDLRRVHVVAAADDQVLDAVDDRQPSFGIEAAHVAGVQEAAYGDLRRGLGVVQVARHRVVAAHHDLAGLARRHVGAGRVDDAQLDAPQRLAHAAEHARVGRCVQGAERGFGQAVALAHLRSEPALGAARDLVGQRRARGQRPAQRG
jgi:hypothetical protein